MNNKEEILSRREELIMRTLKQEYDFVYDHLAKLAREKLEIDSKEQCQDDLTETECHEGHNSESSTSVDFDEAKELLDKHQARLEILQKFTANPYCRKS